MSHREGHGGASRTEPLATVACRTALLMYRVEDILKHRGRTAGRSLQPYPGAFPVRIPGKLRNAKAVSHISVSESAVVKRSSSAAAIHHDAVLRGPGRLGYT